MHQLLHRKSRLFVSSLFIGLVCTGCQSSPPPPSVDAAVGTVTIRVQAVDNPVQTFEIADVSDGATLESVMKRFDQIPVELSGSGMTAFVQSIGDVETDATQGWTFKVDGEFANQGIGKTILHPPTTVDWSYGEFEFEME